MITPKNKYAKWSGNQVLVPGEAAFCGRNHKPLRINLLPFFGF
jgi:hypothetical protein